jgi:hypothetical protein
MKPGKIGGTTAVELGYVPTSLARGIPTPTVSGIGRLGVLPHFEVGAGLTTSYFVAGQAYVKWQVTPPWPLDVALVGRSSFASLQRLSFSVYGSGGGGDVKRVDHFELELLPMLGVNLDENLTLVVSGGPLRSFAPFLRWGFRATTGVQWRIADEVAVMPEVTYMSDAYGLGAPYGFFGGLAVQARGGDDGYARRRPARP